MTTRNDTWGSAATVKNAVTQKWDRGAVLRDLHAEPDAWTTFPLRVRLPGPTRDTLTTQFAAASTWTRTLNAGAARDGWQVVTRAVRVGGLGTQHVPVAGVVPTPQDALRMLGRARAADAERFAAALSRAQTLDPAAAQLVLSRPHDVLRAGEDWPLLIDLADWIRRNPRPGIHLRQIPVAGVHTKVLEQHAPLLARLLDAILPSSAFDPAGRTFTARFGFIRDARRVRLRASAAVLGVPQDGVADVEWDVDALARLEPDRHNLTELLVLENKTSYLVAPCVPGRLVLWGAGYGVDELLQRVPWLHHVDVRYWGDIDTHGFAMLDRMRAVAPHATSVLMDAATLHAHRPFWVREPTPRVVDLPHLTADEQSLYAQLCAGDLGPAARLEQEFIRFDLVEHALRPLPGHVREHDAAGAPDSA